jgi:hypothetical protein
MPPLLACLLAGLPAQTKEIVVVPLTEDGVKTGGIDAWKVVVEEVRKTAGRLGFATALQKSRHDFLIGPVRDEARDCGGNTECLAAIGTTLGVDVLVAGSLAADAVTLTAIDIATMKVVAGARSPKGSASKGPKDKARAASKVLIRALADLGKGEVLAQKTEKVEGGKPPPDGAAKPPPENAAKPPPENAAKPPPGRARPPPPEKVDDPPPPETVADPPPPALEGTLVISKEQLAGVTEVTLDGQRLFFSGDGSITWKGSPGSHALVARRSDETKTSKDVVVNPNETTQVVLAFPTEALPPPVPAEDPEESSTVLTEWWFWVAIGAAVAAGATTAGVLAGGGKGGPSIEGTAGSIRGRY